MILFDVLVQFKNAVEYGGICTIGTRIDFYDWLFRSPEHWGPKSGATEVTMDLSYMLFQRRVSEETCLLTLSKEYQSSLETHIRRLAIT